MNRGALAGPVTALLMTIAMAGAPSASANTYCAPAPCSDGTPEATIQDAITAAHNNTGPDTVSIAPGTWNIGHDLTIGDPDTSIHGAGIGVTNLTEDAPTGSYRYDVVEGTMASLSDLTLQLPTDVTPGKNSDVEGGSIDQGVLERVRVALAPGATIGSGINDGQASGLLLWGSSQLRDSQIALGPDVDSEGLQTLGNNVVANVSVSAKEAFVTNAQSSGGTPKTVQASDVRIEGQRPLEVSDGNLELSDSLIDGRTMPPGEDIGAAEVCACISADAIGSLTLDRVTIAGNGDPGESALFATSLESGHTTTLTARHVTAWPFGRTLSLDTAAGTLNATIAYSNLDTSAAKVVDEGPGTSTLSETFSPGNRAGNPLFRDLAGGDFRLSAGSPAIDIGGPDLIPGAATDLNGDPRPIDGDGDGVAQDDAGAFEYEPSSPAPPGTAPQPAHPVRPVVSRLRLVPAVFAVGSRRTAHIARTHRGTVIHYTLSRAATVRLTIQRRVPGVRGARGRCVKRTRRNRRGRRCTRYAAAQTLVRRNQRAGRHAVHYSGHVGNSVLRPGRYRLLARATGPTGLRSKPRTASFRIVKR